MKTFKDTESSRENKKSKKNRHNDRERSREKTCFLSYEQVLVGGSPDQPVAGHRKLAPLPNAPEGTTAGPSLTGSVPGTGLLVAQRQVRARVASP